MALGVLLPLAKFDNTLDAFLKPHFDFSIGLLFSGTVVALLFAYLVRFIILSYGLAQDFNRWREGKNPYNYLRMAMVNPF